MHNFILNLFGFLRSCTQFVKILLMFLIVLLMLYWIQDLTNNFWSWFVFITPIFEFLLNIGKTFSDDSIYLFSAILEFKYLAVLALIGIVYFMTHLAYKLLDILEDFYDSQRRFFKKIEENAFNSSLAKQQQDEQSKIKTYHIYIQTFVKSAFAHREYNVNLEEQNKILIKHLLEKTNTCPQAYNNGFLFTFYSFEKIDDVLDVFSKLKESKAPIDFMICLQVSNKKRDVLDDELGKLIGLKSINKIITLSNTAYRYKFNKNRRYETLSLGIFRKGQNSYEVCEFINKD